MNYQSSFMAGVGSQQLNGVRQLDFWETVTQIKVPVCLLSASHTEKLNCQFCSIHTTLLLTLEFYTLLLNIRSCQIFEKRLPNQC